MVISSPEEGVYLGLDLSTQSITLLVLENKSHRIVHVDSINFDTDLPQYNTRSGMNVGERGEVTSNVMMWLNALDRLLKRQDTDLLRRVKAISGSAQQHGSVYWNAEGVASLSDLKPEDSLAINLYGGFSREKCPIWADSSTSGECQAMERVVGGAWQVAAISGSRCYERFTGPQITKIARTEPSVWSRTARVSLVSSFLTSILLGRIAPIEASDGSGMNLMNLCTREWSEELIGSTGASNLVKKLGKTIIEAYEALGPISPYCVARYGFSSACLVIPATGDNNSSLVGMGLTPVALLPSPPPSRSSSFDQDQQGVIINAFAGQDKEGTIMISLGTSDTLVGVTKKVRPGIEGHVLVSPRGPEEYFVMLCYKNGSLAREKVRDDVANGDWSVFSELLRSSPPGNENRLGLYLCMAEILPSLNYTGFFRLNERNELLKDDDAFESPASDVRAVVESRFLSMRVHAEQMGIVAPKRILATGGASNNTAMMQVLSDVFDADVFTADIPDSAALGAALRAEHGYACRRNGGKWVDFQASEPQGLKMIASPQPEAPRVYNNEFLGRFSLFESSGHRERKV